jgi:hypothetical protein
MSKLSSHRIVGVVVDDRSWRGLQFEARLLSEVFGLPLTPEDVACARVARPGRNRAPRGAR